MKQAILAFCIVIAFRVSSEEIHSHPPPERLGTLNFPVSCATDVQQEFERSVALLHSFSYSAAEQGFRKIASSDPSCAMAHWGVAMFFFHQLWSPPALSDLREAQSEIEQANHLYWTTQVDVLEKEARAWQLAATTHPEESLELLRGAADEEEAVEKLPVTPGPVVPAREQLGIRAKL